jgi:multiple sugar transport system permease protein
VNQHKSLTISRFFNNSTVAGYIFIMPFIVGLLAFTIIPMIVSLYISFTKYNITTAPKWVGFQNYINMFTEDPLFFKSILVTLYYVCVSVPLKIGFALLVAFVLNRKSKSMYFYRAVYYLPSLIGGSVAVALIWKELFSTQGGINAILNTLGLKSIGWMGDPHFAIWVLISMSVWQFGSSMIIFAAGLKQVPETYYEAARIDGASLWQQFSRITMPALSPVILFNLIMQTIGAFMSFSQAYLITGSASTTPGGPLDSCLFYALYIFRRAFSYFEMGYGSAMAWILLVIIAIATALVFKSSQYWVYYESKEKK